MLVAAFFPRRPALFVQPETSNQREGVVPVEPERIYDIVPVVIWVNFFKSAPVWLLKYAGIIVSGFIPHTSLDFSSNDVEDAHATLQWQPGQYHLRMAE